MMSAALSRPPATPSAVQGLSPWHSPVPYLFGGLAAMLGLIAFALIILACSYWRLSGYFDGDNNSTGERDVELGEANSDEKTNKFEEKFLVIMAGQANPTFLATPMSSRASSFGSNGSGSEVVDKTDGDHRSEKTKEGGVDQAQTGDMESHVTLENQIP